MRKGGVGSTKEDLAKISVEHIEGLLGAPQVSHVTKVVLVVNDIGIGETLDEELNIFWVSNEILSTTKEMQSALDSTQIVNRWSILTILLLIPVIAIIILTEDVIGFIPELNVVIDNKDGGTCWEVGVEDIKSLLVIIDWIIIELEGEKIGTAAWAEHAEGGPLVGLEVAEGVNLPLAEGDAHLDDTRVLHHGNVITPLVLEVGGGAKCNELVHTLEEDLILLGQSSKQDGCSHGVANVVDLWHLCVVGNKLHELWHIILGHVLEGELPEVHVIGWIDCCVVTRVLITSQVAHPHIETIHC
jgi:hypothetical protein